MLTALSSLPQAFEVVARPALDSVSSALDRLRMGVYVTFAKYGLPCPVTLKKGSIGEEAIAKGVTHAG